MERLGGRPRGFTRGGSRSAEGSAPIAARPASNAHHHRFRPVPCINASLPDHETGPSGGGRQGDGVDGSGSLYYQTWEHAGRCSATILAGPASPRLGPPLGIWSDEKRWHTTPRSAPSAELGHLDELLIVDAGYPLPPDGHVIDLTLTPGIPRFLDVLRDRRRTGHRVDRRGHRDQRV